mgnify:CR=1 FL=1
MGTVGKYRELVDRFIAIKLLPIGLFVFLAFNFLVLSRSSYKTFVYVALFLPALIICVTLANDQVELYKKSIGLRLLAIFVVYMSFSSLWASDSDGVNYFKRASYVLLFTVAWLRFRPSWDRFYTLFDIAATIASIAVLIYIYDFYWQEGMSFSERIYGGNSFINPLLSGSMLGVFVCYIFIRMLQYFGTSKKWLVFAGVLIPLLWFVWLTGSRTPLLGIAIVVLMQPFYYRGSTRILWIVSILCCICTVMYIGSHHVFGRGFSLRFDIWLSIIDFWSNAIWIGNGMGNEIRIPVDNKVFLDPHNYHLAVGYYGGMIGFFLWVTCLLWSARSVLKCDSKTYARIAIALLVYGVVASSFDGSSFMGRPSEVWFILWLPIALCLKAEFDTKADKPIAH